MKELARCPGGATGPCGKAVRVTAAGTFANHRRPTGGNCSVGITHRVRIADRIHPCVDCAALPVRDLPVAPENDDGPCALEYRPSRPRAVTGRPPRCFLHKRAHERTLKAARKAKDRERVRGVTEADRALLWTAQGRACAICGHRLNAERRAPSLDHCHDLAATHDHPVEQACRRCTRGLCCWTCNRIVAGRKNVEPTSLLGRYKAGLCPAATIGWWDETSAEPTTETIKEEL